MSYRTNKPRIKPRGSLRSLAFQNRRSDSDLPLSDSSDVVLRSLDNSTDISFVNTTDNSIDCSWSPILHNSTNIISREKTSSAPASPRGTRSFTCNSNLNNLLSIPSVGSINLSPRPLRRSTSVKGIHEFAFSTSSPRSRKNTPGTPTYSPDFFGDSISATNVPVGPEQKREIPERKALSVLISGIYSVFITVLGAIIYINDQHREHRLISEVFNSSIALVGIIWLIFLHIDLCLYKREVLKQLKETEDAMQEACERFSTATEFIFNSGFNLTASQATTGETVKPPPYRFLQGRHSGSFYLKIGSAAFCFGYLIYQGLQLGQHVLDYMNKEMRFLDCLKPSSIALHTIAPLFAFYQLFMTFKYSNIVINRYKCLARFGLMHIIATCLCSWFSTIVEEAVEDYNHNLSGNVTTTNIDIASFHITIRRKENWNNSYHCKAESILSTRSMSAIPYLYPFAIEFNLLLAGVWFVMWQNIGTENIKANPHHLRHTISQDECGSDGITYQSNLVISADCHAANKGLFVGLFLLLVIIVSVIVFFVAISTKGYEEIAIAIHTGQEGILTIIGLFAICISFYQIRKLDLSEHPITFLDDVLLFVPLPFFFIHGIMSVMAEYANQSYTRLAVHVLVTLQVIVQTPFIIDGLRRCSNSQNLRYKKPGREVITFLIILNLTLWVVNTFELKSVEHHHGQEEYFGDLIWMFIGHTTLPLMLFYRFHSSVCLADMWKSAYEKET